MEERLRQAAFDFLSRSYCWRQRDVTLLTTVASQSAYAYDLPANGKLLMLHSCFDGLREIEIEVEGEGDDFYPGETSDSDYRIAVADDGAGFELRPAPATSGVVLKGSVSFIPADNATGIPTWIERNYGQGIAHGAAALLVVEPNKPWSNPASYQFHQGEFNSSIAEASAKAGPVRRRPIRVKPW
jgi:hypothetical protein